MAGEVWGGDFLSGGSRKKNKLVKAYSTKFLSKVIFGRFLDGLGGLGWRFFARGDGEKEQTGQGALGRNFLWG